MRCDTTMRANQEAIETGESRAGRLVGIVLPERSSGLQSDVAPPLASVSVLAEQLAQNQQSRVVLAQVIGRDASAVSRERPASESDSAIAEDLRRDVGTVIRRGPSWCDLGWRTDKRVLHCKIEVDAQSEPWRGYSEAVALADTCRHSFDLSLLLVRIASTRFVTKLLRCCDSTYVWHDSGAAVHGELGARLQRLCRAGIVPRGGLTSTLADTTGSRVA